MDTSVPHLPTAFSLCSHMSSLRVCGHPHPHVPFLQGHRTRGIRAPGKASLQPDDLTISTKTRCPHKVAL